MGHWILLGIVCQLVVLLHQAEAAPVGPLLTELDGYSFEAYVEDFGKRYSSAEEYDRRKKVFNENLRSIIEHNKQSQGRKSGHLLGVNYFADLSADELPLGYNKKQSRFMRSQQEFVSIQSQENVPLSTSRSLAASIAIELEPVAQLPSSVDWRTKGVTTPVKNQGRCGSCWAFASTAVLESHIAIQTDVLFELSEQELVSCAPNPMSCGGRGGCTGATAEIAFEHVRQFGIVAEWAFGYQSWQGDNISCSLTRQGNSLRSLNGVDQTKYTDSVAKILGYVSLESNNYQVLMNAVAKLGPVTVSVAAHPWMFYHSGVMNVPWNVTGATNINHLVVLEGYGTDAATGEDFWLIRNSWGPQYGERGYVRLKREDPNTLDDPESACAMDKTPGDGDACSKDANGNDITPPPVKVCGTSGILHSSAIPVGGYLI